MLFTSLLAALLLVVTGKTVVIERLGAQKAAELTAADERLQREIVERTHAEEALRDNEAKLRQAMKMEAVGRLAGGVAHDFNNLLTAILGYAKLLSRGFEPTDRRRRDLQEIVKAGERAASLTRQLLAFSRRQVLQPTVIDLNARVTESVWMLRRLIGEHIQLVTVLAPDLAHVRADAAQLEQVLVNLVVNARDAMSGGGCITVETANVELDQAYVERHLGSRVGRYVMLAVNDNGIGMDEETKLHLFEPFFTTKERDRGTGLGLATVYGVVKQSGGYISVDSEPGQGAAFKIYLPPAEGLAEASRPVNASDSTPAGSETILVVEDEESVRRLSCTLLEQLGYRVLEASSPKEAEDVFKDEGHSIDLLLTDVVMPGTPGPVLFKKLEASQPGLKVLLMSGYTDTGIVRGGQLDAGVAFLQKPFTAEDLARSVRAVLDTSRSGAHIEQARADDHQ
jgi:signal transduction histidine kinase